MTKGSIFFNNGWQKTIKQSINFRNGSQAFFCSESFQVAQFEQSDIFIQVISLGFQNCYAVLPKHAKNHRWNIKAYYWEYAAINQGWIQTFIFRIDFCTTQPFTAMCFRVINAYKRNVMESICNFWFAFAFFCTGTITFIINFFGGTEYDKCGAMKSLQLKNKCLWFFMESDFFIIVGKRNQFPTKM